MQYVETNVKILKDKNCIKYKSYKMSPFTPIDFIAPMVEVSIVYDKHTSDNTESKWENCIIQKVHRRGLTEDGDKFVVCEVSFLEDPELHIRETLYDSDFETMNDFAWMFSPSFTPLIHQLMTVTYSDVEDEETDEETDECDDENNNEKDVRHNKPSIINRALATIWGLAPWFATFAVVYNARQDILSYLHDKYVS